MSESPSIDHASFEHLLCQPAELDANLFDEMTRTIGETFGVDHVALAELCDRRQGRVRSLSFWSQGRHQEPFEYLLPGTPCAGVYDGQAQSYPDGLLDRFPSCANFLPPATRGYYGLPLISAKREILGNLALISESVLGIPEEAKRCLRVLALRAGLHLDQLRMASLLDQKTLLLQRTATHLPGVIYQFVLFPDGEVAFSYLAPQIKALTGLDEAELLKNAWLLFDRIDPAYQDSMRRTITRTARDLSEFDWTGPIHVDGEIRYLQLTSNPTRQPDGSVEWYGYLSDVTQQKRVELELESVKKRHLEAQRAAGIGHWDLNVITQNVEWSEGESELFGFDPATGPPTFEKVVSLADPEDRGLLEQTLTQAIESGQPFEIDWRVNRPDGQVRHINSRGNPIRDDHGKVSWITGTDFDITARKESEEALQRSAERLRRSQKMEAIGRLAGGVAHDFNNLLTAILGFGQLAVDTLPADHPTRGHIQEIVRAGERAQELTRKLVATGRKQLVEVHPLLLNDILVEMEPLLQRALGTDIEMVLDLGTLDGSIRGDKGSLEQVVLNLVVNARDAMPKGGRLTLTTSQRTLTDTGETDSAGRSGDFIVLSVSDTGCGISEPELEHLFEPFYTTKPEGKGTGLGLSMVYGIVDHVQGFITVDSKPGEGTTFSVFFPHCEEMPISSLVPDRQHLPRGEESILVVEDDAAVRRFTVRSLTSLGYRVLEVDDPLRALDHIRTDEPIDLLFTDVVMPKLSGTELVRRALEIRPALRFLLTTGFTQDGALMKGLNLGAREVLLKPFTIEQLGSRLRDTLDAESCSALELTKRSA